MGASYEQASSRDLLLVWPMATESDLPTPHPNGAFSSVTARDKCEPAVTEYPIAS